MTAIKRVTFFRGNANCSRCGQYITVVCSVTYIDGETELFGTKCIEKILKSDNSLLARFRRIKKRINEYQTIIEILSREPNKQPRGREYFESGIYFIADDSGNDLHFHDHWFFHPIIDAERNQAAGRYLNDPNEFFAAQVTKNAADKEKVKRDLAIQETLLINIFNQISNQIERRQP